jgi:hypothetical protein
MATRLHAVQIHSNTKGWRDLPEELPNHKGEWLFGKEHEAIRASEEITKQTRRPTRVIRKPKGWTPKGPSNSKDEEEVCGFLPVLETE